MNLFFGITLILLIIGSINGNAVLKRDELNFGDEHTYYNPSIFSFGDESELTNKNDGILSSVGNYMFNIFAKIDEWRNSENVSISGNNWSQMINKEMQEIHNSISSLWSETVATHLREIKSFLPNNQTLLKLRESYEQSMAHMNELQRELMSLWRETVTFVSIDNKTLTPNDSELTKDYEINNKNMWQTLKTHYNRVSDEMSLVLTQITSYENKSLSKEISEILNNWSQSMNSINGTQLEMMIIQMQQQLNDIWQKMAIKIANSFNFDNSIVCDECETTQINERESSDRFRRSLERMDRIQRDVQQLWQSITGNNQNYEENQENDISIKDRVQSVWENVKNYYNSRANGSTIEGVLQSATDRVSRIGDYFRNVWHSGSDALSASQQVIQTQRQAISSKVSNLNEHFKHVVQRISGGISSFRPSVETSS